MRKNAALVGIAAAVIGSGCSMVSTELIDDLDQVVPDGSIAYSLPMTVLKLRVLQFPGTGKGNESFEIAEFKHGEKCEYGVEICSEVLTIPDPKHAYVVRFRGSPLSDDTLDVSVSPDGYLASAHGLAKDRTGDIIVGGVKIATGDYNLASLSDERGAPSIVDTIYVDPHDPDQLQKANRRLGRYKLSLACGGACSEAVAPVHGETEDLYFRHQRTIFIQVTDRSGYGRSQMFPVQSFNGSPLIAQRLERAPFITRETTITYGPNGMPTRVAHTKPSEALGVVKIVGQVAGAIVAAPVNAFTQQSDSLAAEQRYLKAREDLAAQQAATAQAVSVGQPKLTSALSDQEVRELKQALADQKAQNNSQQPPTDDVIDDASTPDVERRDPSVRVVPAAPAEPPKSAPGGPSP